MAASKHPLIAVCLAANISNLPAHNACYFLLGRSFLPPRSRFGAAILPVCVRCVIRHFQHAKATITERGPVSIPARLCREMHLKPGQTVLWERVSSTKCRLVAFPLERIAPDPLAALGFARQLDDPSFGATSATCLAWHLGDGLAICPISYIEMAPAFREDHRLREAFLRQAGVSWMEAWQWQDTGTVDRLWADHMTKIAARPSWQTTGR